MKTYSLEVPAMYGDHHVIEVRRLLLEMAGVEEIYASSGFRVVEVHFDEQKVNEDQIKSKLENAGYLGELALPTETGTAGVQEDGKKPFFRHTAAYEQTKQVVSFTQQVPFGGRPLWPCPGFGPIEQVEFEEEVG